MQVLESMLRPALSHMRPLTQSAWASGQVIDDEWRPTVRAKKICTLALQIAPRARKWPGRRAWCPAQLQGDDDGANRTVFQRVRGPQDQAARGCRPCLRARQRI